MFDKIMVTQPRIEERKFVTVHEHRAPTDESVRLLKEFETAAKDKVEKSFYLDSNELKCLFQSWLSANDASKVFGVCFDLNGKRYTLEHKEHFHKTPEQMAQGLFKSLSEKIAVEILSKADMKDFFYGRM